MGKISRASTPLIVIDFGLLDPRLISSGVLSIAQGESKLSPLQVKAEYSEGDMEIDGSTITCRLSAADTLDLDPMLPCFVQYRGVSSNGEEVHTALVECTVGQIIHEEVLQ